MAVLTFGVAQSRPTNTTATSILSGTAAQTKHILAITVANTSAATAAFRLFHHEGGTTYDETTARAWDVQVAIGEVCIVPIDRPWVLVASTANFAVRTDTASALTFTVDYMVRA